MSIPVNLFTWLIAAAPVIIILILLLRFQWGIAEAGAISLCIALISSIFVYKADWILLSCESAKGIWSAFFVLMIVWPAILIYEVIEQADAFTVIQKGMEIYTPNELLRVLAFGWVFAGFFQGITGFGVPVAVCAPLLVGMGVIPIWGVIVPLLGHAWANTFGTLAVAWDTLVELTGIEGNILLSAAFWAAAFLWFFNFFSGVVLCWFYGGMKGIRKGLLAVTLISLIQGGGQLLLSQINQTVAAFIPTTLALAAIFAIGRIPYYRKPWRLENSKIMNRNSSSETDKKSEKSPLQLKEAFVPYYTLALITVIVLLIPPVKSFLGKFRLGFDFPQTETGYGIINDPVSMYSSFTPFIHSGTLLFAAGMIAYFYFRHKKRIFAGDGKSIAKRTVEKTIPATVAVTELIIMSKLMAGTGQTIVLAAGTSNVVGNLYVVLAPFVGVLGAFITSSNMASNILFAQFQQLTANYLDLSDAALLGAQTAGGAIGNTVAPGNIILGTTTAGILGYEGIILKKIIPVALCAALFCGIILLFKLIVFA